MTTAALDMRIRARLESIRNSLQNNNNNNQSQSVRKLVQQHHHPRHLDLDAFELTSPNTYISDSVILNTDTNKLEVVSSKKCRNVGMIVILVIIGIIITGIIMTIHYRHKSKQCERKLMKQEIRAWRKTLRTKQNDDDISSENVYEVKVAPDDDQDVPERIEEPVISTSQGSTFSW